MKFWLKNIFINKFSKLPKKLYILYLEVIGFCLYLRGNSKALKKIEDLGDGYFNLKFFNSDNFLIMNHVRANRFLKGIENAGLKIFQRYFLNEIQLKQIDMAIDVGANVGEFSYYCFLNKIEVHSFEPDPYIFRCLQQNLKKCDDVHLYRIALSNENTKTKLFSDPLGANSSLYYEGNINSEKFLSVEAVRFDSLNILKDSKSCILKMDTEGYEAEVLNGFSHKLKFFRYISIDCGPERNGSDTLNKSENELINFGVKKIRKNNWILIGEN